MSVVERLQELLDGFVTIWSLPSDEDSGDWVYHYIHNSLEKPGLYTEYLALL